MIINKIREFNKSLRALYNPLFENSDKAKSMAKLLSVFLGIVLAILFDNLLSNITSLHRSIIMAMSISTGISLIMISYKIMMCDVKKYHKKINKVYQELSMFLEKNEKEIIQYIHKNYINKEDVIYKINFPELKLSFMNKEYEKTLQIILLLDNVIKENAPISDKYTLEEQIKLSQYDSLMKVEENVEKEINHKYQL